MAGPGDDGSMTDATRMDTTITYSDRLGSACWEGRSVPDAGQFKHFIRHSVRERVTDHDSPFDAELRSLATTGMETEFVERLLKATPSPAGWEIGEALAECVLQLESGREICWPWNSVRDRRTPRASLPGADLVGFCQESGSVWLLFGEVKTSSELGTPPNVMYGGSGMAWQLQETAKRLDVQRSLLVWLQARCRGAPFQDYFRQAVSRFLRSRGRDVLVVGVLIRDTTPNRLDLEGRGRVLSRELVSPTRVELLALYLPVPISDWPDLMRENAP